MIQRTLFFLMMLANLPTLLYAQVDFNRDVRPILADHCFRCHGQDEASRQGGLRLNVREGALGRGDSNLVAVLPGNPDESELIKRISTHDASSVMPPADKNDALTTQQIEILRKWITEGAVYGAHWAFVAPKKPTLPRDGIHPIDAFVWHRLEKEGLKNSPIASPETLCRRIHLDLIGLPPTPQAVDSFVTESSAKGLVWSVGNLIDRLLQDKRYGEKWARHWLDVARYSDSNGFEKDLPREQWIWRDWVIESLNSDQPYDQFLIEQFAGDLLPQATQQQKIATGFLRNSMINEEGAIVPEEWRMEAMFDRLDALGSGILGLSLKCGQCHSHKFDPLEQNEYYGIFAFLNNTYEAQSWIYNEEQLKKIAQIRHAISTTQSKWKTENPGWKEKVSQWESAELAKWQGANWQYLHATDTHSSSELNHPEVLPDESILTLGHKTINGDVHFFAEPIWENVTGVCVEILNHGDLPFEGPGRSFKGTWAISEFSIEAKKPDSDKWERLKLINPTADYSESLAGMEREWENKSQDKENRRLRGPVSFLVDGDPLTAWRADRGPGRRNSPSVAVAQFEQPVTLPAGSKLKVAVLTNHGGDDNGPKNTQVGRFRVSFTTASNPQVNSVPLRAIQAMQVPANDRSLDDEQSIFDGWIETVAEAKPLRDQMVNHWKEFPEGITSVMHLAERRPRELRKTFRLDRGVWNRPREEVMPHVPASLHPLPPSSEINRLSFARWLADRSSPLTARVAVNRIWHHLFGIGIVETTEDFGTRSPAPSHQELLDWLAVEFMDRGWSTKSLLRLIMTSQTYLQSSHATAELVDRDPANRLLARGPRFRLEAEQLRDLALHAAGILSQKQGGPSVFPPVPQNVLDFNFFPPDYWKPATDENRYARAMYVFRKRSMPDPTMIVFDAPTGDATCTRRPRSNSPLAALTSLNEPIFVEAAQHMALRILREGGVDDWARIRYACRLCLSRFPSEQEQHELTQLLIGRREKLKTGQINANEIAFADSTKAKDIPPDATPMDVAAWAIVCRVLLNLDETLTKN